MGSILHFFSPMRNASAKGIEMKAPSNNNLPSQTDDVIVNPRNPDSNFTPPPTQFSIHYPPFFLYL
jgi:hypothetical protein